MWMGVTNSTISSSRRNGRERFARPRLAAVKDGVWPEFNHGSWPECCDGPAFNMTKVEELADDLQNYWPTLYCSPPRQCNGKVTGNFWQHEVLHAAFDSQHIFIVDYSGRSMDVCLSNYSRRGYIFQNRLTP